MKPATSASRLGTRLAVVFATAFLICIHRTPALAQDPSCDPVCAQHEVAVSQALAAQPEVAALRSRLAALASRPVRQGEVLDPTIRLTVQQLGIPPHMEPMSMLMVEQPVQSRTQYDRASGALRAEHAAAAAGVLAEEAELRAVLRELLVDWQGAAERVAVLRHHLEMALQLERVAANAPQVAAQPARLLALQQDRATLTLELQVAESDKLSAGEQLLLRGVALPDEPTLGVALQPLPSPPDLSGPLALAEAALGERERRDQHMVRANAAAVRAELAPVWMPGLGVMRMEGMPFGLMLSLGLRWPDAPWLASRNTARTGDVAARLAASHADAEAERAALRRQQAVLARRWALQDTQLRGVIKHLRPLAEHRYRVLTPLLGAGQATALDAAGAAHDWLVIDLRTVTLRAEGRRARIAWLRLAEGGRPKGAPTTGATPPATPPANANAMGGH